MSDNAYTEYDRPTDDLAPIRERLAMATGTFLTSLPWRADHVEDGEGSGYYSGEVYGGHKFEYLIVQHALPSMADFVANAPFDVAYLLAEVDRLRDLASALAFPVEDAP